MSGDELALEELFRVSPRGAVHVIRHYLYFATEQVGGEVAAELRRQGYAIEERLGGDDINWLVLATHQIIPSVESIASIREAMETLADRFDGEYDGWEAEALT